jgi:transposase
MRYELSDYEWTAIKPMLPNKPRGVRRVNDRRVLNGIFWVLRSGAPWRDLPEVYGPRTTCYNRFVRWRRAGVWDQIMDALAAGHDAAVQMIDTVRVHSQHRRRESRARQSDQPGTSQKRPNRCSAALLRSFEYDFKPSVGQNAKSCELQFAFGQRHDGAFFGRIADQICKCAGLYIDAKDVACFVQRVSPEIGDRSGNHSLGFFKSRCCRSAGCELWKINTRLHQHKISVAGVDHDALGIFAVERAPRAVSRHDIDGNLEPGADQFLLERFLLTERATGQSQRQR